MGLTSFSGEFPAIKDIGVAKNYLKEDEFDDIEELISFIRTEKKMKSQQVKQDGV